MRAACRSCEAAITPIGRLWRGFSYAPCGGTPRPPAGKHAGSLSGTGKALQPTVKGETMFRIALISTTLALAACGPGSDIEVKVSAQEGVRPIKGSLSADNLDNFTCGDTLGDGQLTVTTHAVNGGCEFVFEH